MLATLQPVIEKRVEEKIMQALGLVISGKISEYYDKAASNEAMIMRSIEDKVNRKANQVKSDLKVEISRDTEAMLNNQLTDFRKTIRTTMANTVTYAPPGVKSSVSHPVSQVSSEK